MPINHRNVDLSVRIRCFLCDANRHPWALVRECNQWFCRQCVNYEGNQRLPYTITITRIMKNHVRTQLGLRLKTRITEVMRNTGQEQPFVVTLPSNYSVTNISEHYVERPVDLRTEVLNNTRTELTKTVTRAENYPLPKKRLLPKVINTDSNSTSSQN